MNQPEQGSQSEPVHDMSPDMSENEAAGLSTEVTAPQADAPCRNRTYNLVIKSHPRNRAKGGRRGTQKVSRRRKATDRAEPDPNADSHFPDISPDTRHCPRCREDKPLEAFGTRTRPSGIVSPQPYCRPCMVAYHKTWRATESGHEKFGRKLRESRARYPERQAARRATLAAIRTGRLTRGACYAAGSDCAGPVESHHDDYARPLEVTWTCRAHHRALDRARRAA